MRLESCREGVVSEQGKRAEDGRKGRGKRRSRVWGGKEMRANGSVRLQAVEWQAGSNLPDRVALGQR